MAALGPLLEPSWNQFGAPSGPPWTLKIRPGGPWQGPKRAPREAQWRSCESSPARPLLGRAPVSASRGPKSASSEGPDRHVTFIATYDKMYTCTLRIRVIQSSLYDLSSLGIRGITRYGLPCAPRTVTTESAGLVWWRDLPQAAEYTYTYVHMHVCAYTYIRTHIHRCMYNHTYAYTHIHV